METTSRMSKVINRVLSTVLAICLCFSALIFSSGAADENANRNGQINSATNNGNGNNGNSIGNKKSYIIGTKTEAGADQVIAKNPGKGKKLGHNKKLLTAELSTEEAAVYLSDPNILYIEEDFIVAANRETSEIMPDDIRESFRLYVEDSPEKMEWDVKAVEAEEAHNQEYKGSGIKVAILDSGVDSWSNLGVIGGIDLVGETAKPSFDDLNGHGTAVAGIICSPITGTGLIGVAPESELYAVKVLDQYKAAPVSRILLGIDWCIEQGIQVINMSFGTSNYSIALDAKIKEAYTHGIVLVASAGNNGTEGGIQYPAKHPEVIAVASVDSSMKRASSSATGVELSVSAPGERVQSAGLFGGLAVVDGTSIAAPHVAGVVAVLLGKNSNVSPLFIQGLIEASAKPLGAEIEYGKGLVDLAYALELYDDFAENYSDPTYMPNANDMTVQDYSDEENYVNGMWNSAGHGAIIDNSIWVGANATNIATMKRVSNRTDTAPYMEQKRFHGLGNYVKTARYLFDVAKGYMHNSNYNHATFTPSYYNGAYTHTNSLPYGPDNVSVMTNMRNLISQMIQTEGATTAATKKWVVLGIFAHMISDLYAHRSIVPYSTVSGINPLTRSSTKFGSLDFPIANPLHPSNNDAFDINLMRLVLHSESSGLFSHRCWACFQRTVELGICRFIDVKRYGSYNTSYYEDDIDFRQERYLAASTILWQFYAMAYYNDQPFNSFFFLTDYPGLTQYRLKLDLLFQYSLDYESASGEYQDWLDYTSNYVYTTFLCNKSNCSVSSQQHYVVNNNLYNANLPLRNTPRFPANCKYAFEV